MWVCGGYIVRCWLTLDMPSAGYCVLSLIRCGVCACAATGGMCAATESLAARGRRSPLETSRLVFVDVPLYVTAL